MLRRANSPEQVFDASVGESIGRQVSYRYVVCRAPSLEAKPSQLRSDELGERGSAFLARRGHPGFHDTFGVCGFLEECQGRDDPENSVAQSMGYRVACGTDRSRLFGTVRRRPFRTRALLPKLALPTAK